MENQFEKLIVWQKAHKLVILIYKITSSFPKDEKFSLTDQLRRCTVSIAANISEGNIRNSKKEFIQFLYIAKGSLEETKYYLLLSRDLSYISPSDYSSLQKLSVECGKLINLFLNYLKANL